MGGASEKNKWNLRVIKKNLSPAFFNTDFNLLSTLSTQISEIRACGGGGFSFDAELHSNVINVDSRNEFV